MHRVRRASLVASVLGALRGRRLTVTAIGRALPGGTSQKHAIKRADRLLSNRHLHGQQDKHYQGLCRPLIGARSRPVLLVDWSDLDARKRHYLLRASLAVNGRSITVYEEVHTLAGKDKRRTHRAFLQQLQAVLPVGCRPIIVTDAGFRTPWLLATSLPVTRTLARQVVRLYRLRMSIEEGFRDMKSHQFGLGLTYHRYASVERLQVLVFIASLALLVLWLVGTATIAQGAHYQFQANSVRHKRILSVLFVGLQLAQHGYVPGRYQRFQTINQGGFAIVVRGDAQYPDHPFTGLSGRQGVVNDAPQAPVTVIRQQVVAQP